MESAIEKFTFHKAKIGKSDMTSGDKFRITITTNKGMRKRTFIFHDNYLNNSSKEEIMKCLVDDHTIIENYWNSFKGFMSEFGYNNIKDARKIWELMRNNCSKLEFVLGRNLIKQLKVELASC